MFDMKWSASEKNQARQVYEQARLAELAEVLAEFKARAAAADTIDDMWTIRDLLDEKQRELDEKYDYRYSQLIFVFCRLIREGRVRLEQLEGLSENKLALIRDILSL